MVDTEIERERKRERGDRAGERERSIKREREAVERERVERDRGGTEREGENKRDKVKCIINLIFYACMSVAICPVIVHCCQIDDSLNGFLYLVLKGNIVNELYIHI